MKKAFPADHAVPISKDRQGRRFRLYVRLRTLGVQSGGPHLRRRRRSHRRWFGQEGHALRPTGAKPSTSSKRRWLSLGARSMASSNAGNWLTDQRDFGAFNAITRPISEGSAGALDLPMRFNFAARLRSRSPPTNPVEERQPARAKARRKRAKALKGAASAHRRGQKAGKPSFRTGLRSKLGVDDKPASTSSAIEVT